MPTAADMVADARKRVENLTVEQTAREVEAGDALLVDIREFWADPASPYHREELAPDRRIILHCASGGRSALAAATLQDLGFERVAHMDGGIAAWKESGRPVQGGG
jgi:rhodanese-related sulfurtransferase